VLESHVDISKLNLPESTFFWRFQQPWLLMNTWTVCFSIF
jgi:hypothetical protein